MTLTAILQSALILLRLSNPDGIYSIGDTVRVYANDGAQETVVLEEVCTQKENRIFHYEDTCIGWVVAPEQMHQALPCPKDFDKFWKGQLKAMRKIPMNTKLVEMDVPEPDKDNYVCWSIEMDCVDGTPVRGYVAMPRNAKKKSLPVVLFVRAAGVAGHWCRSSVWQAVNCAKWGGGAIAIDVNAFGMLNDQPQKYYDDLEQGELKGYSKRPCNTREEYFFKNMYLRDVRAIDYACSLPEWDGKRVLVYGQSQGGAQAFAVAGLDKRVSAVVGIVPAGCNNAGSAASGRDSWPFNYREFASSALGCSILPYYDGCNFLARTKAKLWIEIGLMDVTCTPEAIYSALNVNKSKERHVKPSPWRYHDEPSPRYWKDWSNTIYKERFEFINDYLRAR